jgi:hypothetical protein
MGTSPAAGPSARPPVFHHGTSEPLHFFGRQTELALLDAALREPDTSLVGLVGPGGQGKTAIVQEWLRNLLETPGKADGIFFWSFYRSKDSDLCLRELYRYVAGTSASDLNASYCVDQLLPILRRERLAAVLDGAEVVQHESGPWSGRFVHPELARLLEELASVPAAGVVVVTTRFALPTLVHRRHARLIDLSVLDPQSARGLLCALGVKGRDVELDEVSAAAGCHAKGVELLGTWLTHFAGAAASRWTEAVRSRTLSARLEDRVAAVLDAFQRSLPQEASDILALATAFRQPPTESRLRDYLVSQPVRQMLHATWQRTYLPLEDREARWLAAQIQYLIDLRLLERIGSGAGNQVIDAHPLVRQGFEQYLGPVGHRQSAWARAGFLRGRPDRRPPRNLEEASEEVELFLAYCDAGLWNEADSTFVALDNPKHRFLAPAFERDLLLRFFPGGDFRTAPLWAGFGRWRSLAICLEMLGQFADALDVYRPGDAALRGDALIALGRLRPLLDQENVQQPWQNLWRAYRCHALCLAGRTAEALALARTLIPLDLYECVHVFECLLRTGELRESDVRSMMSAMPECDNDWQRTVRRRLWADWRRVSQQGTDLDEEFAELTDRFDRAGLPWERALVRLSWGRWLLQRGEASRAAMVANVVLDLAIRHAMPIVLVDALELDPGHPSGNEARRLRQEHQYLGPPRP